MLALDPHSTASNLIDELREQFTVDQTHNLAGRPRLSQPAFFHLGHDRKRGDGAALPEVQRTHDYITGRFG